MTDEQWHPKVGQLARHRSDLITSARRAVLAVGERGACVSLLDKHTEPGFTVLVGNLVRACPEGHDWGGDPNGDTCETCHPPAPPIRWQPGDLAMYGDERVVVVGVHDNGDAVQVIGVGYGVVGEFSWQVPASELTPDPDAPVRCDPTPVRWANVYPSVVGGLHGSEAAARNHARPGAVEVAVPLYREVPR